VTKESAKCSWAASSRCGSARRRSALMPRSPDEIDCLEVRFESATQAATAALIWAGVAGLAHTIVTRDNAKQLIRPGADDESPKKVIRYTKVERGVGTRTGGRRRFAWQVAVVRAWVGPDAVEEDVDACGAVWVARPDDAA